MFFSTLDIYVEGQKLDLAMGLSFYLTLTCGILNMLLYLVSVLLLRCGLLRTFSTFLELDFDTPWENKKIREDMEEKKKPKETSVSSLSSFYIDSEKIVK